MTPQHRNWLPRRYESERLAGELADAKESLTEEQAAKDLLNENINRLTAEVDTLQTELAVAKASAAQAAVAGAAAAGGAAAIAAAATDDKAVRELEVLLETRNKELADANDKWVGMMG